MAPITEGAAQLLEKKFVTSQSVLHWMTAEVTVLKALDILPVFALFCIYHSSNSITDSLIQLLSLSWITWCPFIQLNHF